MEQRELLMALAASLRKLVAMIDAELDTQKESKTVQHSGDSNTPDDRYMS